MIVCENSVAMVSCPSGKISNIHVKYGREEPKYCPIKSGIQIPKDSCPLQTCDGYDEMCEGISFCSFDITDKSMGGDPCDGIPKYSEITWECEYYAINDNMFLFLEKLIKILFKVLDSVIGKIENIHSIIDALIDTIKNWFSTLAKSCCSSPSHYNYHTRH